MIDEAMVCFLSDLSWKISENLGGPLEGHFYFNGSVCGYNSLTHSYSMRLFQLKMHRHLAFQPVFIIFLCF